MMAEGITVVYARKSTTQQQSVPWQVEWGRSICREKGWSYGWSYEESGGHSDDLSLQGRPQLRQMLEDARAGKFRRVVVWDRTRLARGEHLTMLIDYLNSVGVKVFLGDVPDVGDNTEILLDFLKTMDKHFLRALRKNTRRGLENAREKGHRIGRVPAGFRLVDKKTLEIEPWARDIEEMAHLGMTPTQIRRVIRNIRFYDTGGLEGFLAEQLEKSVRRYAEAKERRDKDAREFEMWLMSIRPLGSERASL